MHQPLQPRISNAPAAHAGIARVSLIALIWVAFGGLMGCEDEIQMVDSIDIEFDLSPFDGPSDKLHLPYVRGTRVRLWVRGEDAEDHMRVVSRDVARFEEVQDERFAAVAEGDAQVEVVDGSGQVLRRRALPIRVPDRVEVRAHGPLLVDTPAAPLDGARILVGGTATFLVEYFEGERRLFGNDVLTVEAPPTVEALNQTSYLVEDREWLTVTAFEPGVHVLRLFADGVPVGRFELTVVEADAVEAIVLHHDQRADKNGRKRVVWAEAVGLDGETVHGVDVEWDVDGVEAVGSGDLFRYEVDRDRSSTLCARFGESEALTDIHADWGTVDSSANVGCAVSRPGVPGGGAGAPMLLLGVLLTLRRRVTEAAP